MYKEGRRRTLITIIKMAMADIWRCVQEGSQPLHFDLQNLNLLLELANQFSLSIGWCSNLCNSTSSFVSSGISPSLPAISSKFLQISLSNIIIITIMVNHGWHGRQGQISSNSLQISLIITSNIHKEEFLLLKKSMLLLLLLLLSQPTKKQTDKYLLAISFKLFP